MLLNILIVEDDIELQELYAAMLEGINLHILRAYDIVQARSILSQKAPPDLVILDMLLDESAGEILFRDMKQDPQLTHIPIIISTVLTKESCQNLVDCNPGVVFLRKPFFRNELLEAVDTSLGPDHSPTSCVLTI